MMAKQTEEPLCCALVGCGKVAQKHLDAILSHKKELSLSGLVDTQPEAARALLQRKGAEKRGIPVYSDLQTLLKNEKTDLVAITTPSGTHYNLARQALQARKHVLVEKPMTLSLSEADMLLAVAKEQGVQIAVGHIYRYFPLVSDLEKDLRMGRFGRILYGDVKVRWGHDQAYYDSAPWRGTWTQDGGVLMNQSIHALDLMTWLLCGSITEVCGWIDQQMHKIEAEDLGLAMFKLCNGAYCLLEGTTNTNPKRHEASFTIMCSDGEIKAGLNGSKLQFQVIDRHGRNLTSQYIRRYLHKTGRAHEIHTLKHLKNPHYALYKDLISSIRQQHPPLADGHSGRNAVEAILAVYASAKEKRTIPLPLVDFSLQDMDGYFSD